MKTAKEQAIEISNRIIHYLKPEFEQSELEPRIYNNVARILTEINSITEEIQPLPEQTESAKGIICKDKNIEEYAFKNYGRLSGMTTIGIIITALTEYASQPSNVSDEDIESKYPTTIDAIFEQLKINPNRVTDGVVEAVRSVQSWNECRQQGAKAMRDGKIYAGLNKIKPTIEGEK